MKKNTPINRIYSFHSISSPHDFIERVRDEAVKSNLKVEQTEKGFDLQINSNHGGAIVYRANVSTDDNGCSLIRGEIISIPWSNKPEEKKNFFQKILSILGNIIAYIIILPFVLIFLLCYGVYSLFVRMFHGKTAVITDEEKVCDFMKNKLYCKQIEE